jgi:hypothetical protein
MELNSSEKRLMGHNFLKLIGTHDQESFPGSL